ncbi:hypothetical protein C1O66_13000 [Paucibacter aquatile]|uniref:RHS repeat protein n=1 Tax=Kinneretia aquatilis TaxID=2070761 RepID=A0A2N8KY82_9BURK|nr:hypothetical protein [Paucibacter aquatile]PND38352.1 hypothetical protein C1O66_13000 [Paucibacter aquatile]
MLRSEVLILPTEIRDRFGNRLLLKYNSASPWQLESITSDDGRSLTFSYVAGSYRVATVSDGTRTWRYNYGPDRDLSSVEQPDGKLWTFSNAGVLAYPPRYAINPDCSGSPGVLAPFSTTPISFQHPSGARGEFRFQAISHGRSFVPEQCFGGTEERLRYPL